MNPYLTFVEGIQSGIDAARNLTVSGATEPIESDSKVLLFSPHPDDECIIGLLPLRITRETKMQVINVPVTYGSNVERQAGRAQELDDACRFLGWDILNHSDGYESLVVEDVVAILEQFQPEVIVMPHSGDWNSRHISTHFMVMEALKKMDSAFSCTVVETEFWGAMDDPNLMVEADAQTVADLVAATSLHTGEVARNPYHLLLPAWMQDNVRRGGELVGGQGGEVPDFSFATLYRLSKWADAEMQQPYEGGRYLAAGEDPSTLLSR